MTQYANSEGSAFFFEQGGKVYAAARAQIISEDQVRREYAFALDAKELNKNFLWISGRYVQGEQANRNGQFWTTEDLKAGEYSVKYTPLNVLHEFTRPVGVIVETKMVYREGSGEGKLLPEIQALSAVWAHNFPEVAQAAREAHSRGQLWYSMECVAESRQCLTCNEQFAWASTELCEHLSSSRVAPRRFINPEFLGGALIFPPAKPGWKDADIEEVARQAVNVSTALDGEDLTPKEREALLHLNALVARSAR